VRHWPSRAFGMPTTYIESLRRASALPMMLTAPDEDPEETLSLVDGLMLMGGGDVEPSRYGGGSHERLYGIEPDRDALEIALLHAVARDGVPTLAICRGIQVMNVAFGGTLHQHLPDVEGMGSHGPPLGDEPVQHAVKLAVGSKVSDAAGTEVLMCSSHHHQGIDRLGDGLVPTGWSEDGLAEAVELDGDGWMIGVQWHPEESAAFDPTQQRLFEELVHRAQGR
jgi:putative glutamine amidotransferase